MQELPFDHGRDDNVTKLGSSCERGCILIVYFNKP